MSQRALIFSRSKQESQEGFTQKHGVKKDSDGKIN